MGVNFRKSLKIGMFRANIGKSGIGLSTGVKGLRVGIGPKGKRLSTSIPGTGLSYTKTLGKKDHTDNNDQNSVEFTQPQVKRNRKINKIPLVIIVFSVLVIVLVLSVSK